MLFALGAASTAASAIQSLASSATTSASSTGFDLSSLLQTSTGSSSSGTTGFTGGGSQISPATMQALLAAQSQASGSTSAAASATASVSTSPADALQNLFSQIDANGDGQITKSEFENALGAGGTNTAAADDVFSKLDSNGDGTVGLDELSSALKGAGGPSRPSSCRGFEHIRHLQQHRSEQRSAVAGLAGWILHFVDQQQPKCIADASNVSLKRSRGSVRLG